MPHRASSNELSKHNRELPCSRITVEEIAGRLGIGRLAVYAMLKEKIIPGILLGRRWIVTRYAYEQWERTCGMRPSAGLTAKPEVMG